MNNYKSFTFSILTIFLLITSNVVNAENHHDKSPSFKTTKLNKNIVMLQGRGENLVERFSNDRDLNWILYSSL